MSVDFESGDTFSNRMELIMNNHMFDLMMLAIMVPTALIMFLYEYPKKWKERKFIFGVRNREEFKNIDTAERVGHGGEGGYAKRPFGPRQPGGPQHEPAQD